MQLTFETLAMYGFSTDVPLFLDLRYFIRTQKESRRSSFRPHSTGYSVAIARRLCSEQIIGTATGQRLLELLS